MTSSSDKNCSSKSIDLLSQTGLDTLVRPVPHAKKEKTITYHLRPTDLIRLIHSRNRKRFGKIFGANKTELKAFWESLFSTEEGREFKELHPTLRLQQPEDLKTTIPIVVHEDAAPYQKKRSVNVLQWGPLFYHGSDIESRYVHHGYISQEKSAGTARKA